MSVLLEPPLTASRTGAPRSWQKRPPVPCRQIDESRAMILRAADAVRPGRAIALGAGRCREIPLRALAERFERVTLIDHDATKLDEALASSGLDRPGLARIDCRRADLTGLTDRFLRMVSEALASPGAGSPEVAAARLTMLAASAAPLAFSTGAVSDLVIASCVMSQLHVAACHGALDRFSARHPGQLERLRQSPAWIEAMEGLTRRVERTFLQSLAGLVAPSGRIYLSDTVQGAFFQREPGGLWLTDGFHGMTRTTNLRDDLDDERFQVEGEQRWHWVLEPPANTNLPGRLFEVQALVLSIPPP
jgi:hypothetical protein